MVILRMLMLFCYIENEDGEIALVMEDGPITDRPFTFTVYQKAQKSLNRGKSHEKANIVSEILEWVLIGDHVLHFTKLIADLQHSAQWKVIDFSTVDIITMPKTRNVRRTDD